MTLERCIIIIFQRGVMMALSSCLPKQSKSIASLARERDYKKIFVEAVELSMLIDIAFASAVMQIAITIGLLVPYSFTSHS